MLRTFVGKNDLVSWVSVCLATWKHHSLLLADGAQGCFHTLLLYLARCRTFFIYTYVVTGWTLASICVSDILVLANKYVTIFLLGDQVELWIWSVLVGPVACRSTQPRETAKRVQNVQHLIRDSTKARIVHAFAFPSAPSSIEPAAIYSTETRCSLMGGELCQEVSRIRCMLGHRNPRQEVEPNSSDPSFAQAPSTAELYG